jgi:hypothetical protein
MLKIPFTVLSVLLGVAPSITILAQSGAKPVGTTSVSSGEPVLNAPYSARRRFTSVTKLTDGTISRIESVGSEARDSQGRKCSVGERHWTYFDGEKNILKSEMLYRIDDPVADTETKWDTTSKVVKVIHWPQSVPKESASAAECQAACGEAMMNTSGVAVEKLGARTIADVVAEGTRTSYTVSAGQDHKDQPIVVIHERWYSPELKIVILETNDDPRSGSIKSELIDIIRGEPDFTQYRPPADYVVRDLQLPE